MNSQQPKWYLGFVCAGANVVNFIEGRRWLTSIDSQLFILNDATKIIAEAMPEPIFEQVVHLIAIIDARIVLVWLRNIDGKDPIFTTHFSSVSKLSANARALALEIYAELILKQVIRTEEELIERVGALYNDLVMYEVSIDALISDRAMAYVQSLRA